MAKNGLDISSVTQILRDVKGNGGWSLCVGAGTSVPVVPNWFALVEKLINKHCKAEDIIDIKLFQEMGFSADAMIQAVKNRLIILHMWYAQLRIGTYLVTVHGMGGPKANE